MCTRFANVGRPSGRRERPASARAVLYGRYHGIVDMGTVCAFCFLEVGTHSIRYLMQSRAIE